jgi:hypothetical protein
MLPSVKSSLSRLHLITLLIVIAASIIISTTIILVTRNDSQLGPFFSNWMSNTAAVAAVIMAIIATLTAFRLHKSIKNSSRNDASSDDNNRQITEEAARQHSYCLLALTIGLILWLIAEFTWTYYQLVVGIENPFPSAADGFWLAGYLFFLYFVLGMNKAVAKGGIYDREALLLISASAGLALAYTFSLLFGTQELVPSVQNRLGWMISLLYPILDTIVLVPSLVLIGLVRGRKEQSAVTSVWLIIAGWIVLVTIADIAFSYSQRIGELGELGWFTDIVYSGSYIFIAGALYWYYGVLTIYRK